MITDLFSHKIHSSGLDWPDKLIELAAIFSEFDGHVFDREQFANRLQDISPRVSYLAADASFKANALRDNAKAIWQQFSSKQGIITH